MGKKDISQKGSRYNEYNTKIFRRKNILLLLIMVYFTIYSMSYDFMGSKYYSGIYSFGVYYHITDLISSGNFNDMIFTKLDTTFYPLEGYINSRSTTYGSIVLILLLYLVNSEPVFISTAISTFMITLIILFLYLVFRNKKNKFDLILLSIIIVLIFTNPILFTILNGTPFIFLGICFISYIFLKISLSNKVKERITWIIISIITIAYIYYSYYTAAYVLIIYILSLLSMVYIYNFLGMLQSILRINYDRTKIPKYYLITIPILFLLSIIIISNGIDIFSTIISKLHFFLDFPNIIQKLEAYYFQHKILGTNMNSTMNITYIQHQSYRLSIIFMILISISIILSYVYFLLKKMYLKREIVVSPQTIILEAFIITTIILTPLFLGTNAFDRIPWFITFCAILVLLTYFKNNTSYFKLCFIGYIIISMLTYIPINTSPAYTYQIYTQNDIITYNWLLQNLEPSSIVLSDLKTSGYLINHGLLPMTINEANYQTNKFNYPILKLYEDPAKFINIVREEGADYFLITSDMVNENKTYISFNFYLKPLPEFTLNSFKNTSMDMIYASGENKVYKIN